MEILCLERILGNKAHNDGPLPNQNAIEAIKMTSSNLLYQKLSHMPVSYVSFIFVTFDLSAEHHYLFTQLSDTKVIC